MNPLLHLPPTFTLHTSLSFSSILNPPTLSIRVLLPQITPHLSIPPIFKPPNSLSSVKNQLSDADEDDFNDEDDIDADEYDEIFGDNTEVSGESEEDEEFETQDNEVEAVSFWSSDDSELQRVQKLFDEVREFGAGIIDVNELASFTISELTDFRLAIKAFLRGSSLVVSAPTSRGKTLIAEAAAVATVARGKRLFYTTPPKALSNQKFREFRSTFGDSNVGLLTGDSAINKDAQVLIMTTEILRNMLHQSVGVVSSVGGLFDVDVIVLDEVLYLSDISRGTVWKETGINTNVIFLLRETASAWRGENELWLAMVLQDRVLFCLQPAQLAAVCRSLVCDGIKVRPWKNNRFDDCACVAASFVHVPWLLTMFVIYEPSSTVVNILDYLEEPRNYLLQIQDKHDVQPIFWYECMIEAWASGLTWREIMMDCVMDEGDLARLLRRTIGLLAQIPKLPVIDPSLQRIHR